MKLTDLITQVKDDKLNKDQLMGYDNELCNLRAKLRLELAELKKEKALFMVKREAGIPVASRKEEWDATPRGQRKFEIEAYVGAVGDLLSSIKTRLYNTYEA